MNNEGKATLLHKDQVQYTIDSSDRNEIYQLHRRPDPAIYPLHLTLREQQIPLKNRKDHPSGWLFCEYANK